jgi:hypothetical protein
MGEAMKFTRIAVLLFVLISNLLAASNADATLIPSLDGTTVYDSVLKVNWMANANLAGTLAGKFGIAHIGTNGAMDYHTAVLWVAALNGPNGDTLNLGHHNWQLPTSPATDHSCSATGAHGNSFGWGCMNSAMGSLFYQSLGLQYPDTAVAIPNGTVGPFTNFQPYLYWSGMIASAPAKGYRTFSFNTGWVGANVRIEYLYVLPMIPGRLCTSAYCPTYHATTFNTLEVSDDGKVVYDPDAVDPVTGVIGVTWLADADLAKTRKFGAQCSRPNGTKCINPDGSMTLKTAKTKWITGMNTYQDPGYNSPGYLGQSNWQLPPIAETDQTCSLKNFGFGCTGSPMGELFYDQLGQSKGTPVLATPNINVGPFNHIQPYLYWSSCEPPNGQSPCLAVLSDGVTPAPAPGFEFSFSFGNGFQDTDVTGNDLYVMVYYPETPEQSADTTPPVTTVAVSGPLGSHGWYVGPTIVDFTAVDDLSGVFRTEFSLDDGATWTTGASVSLSASAVHNILYRSTDFVGNAETPKSMVVKLDTKPPVTTASTRLHKIQGVTISLEVDLSAFDNLSGVANTEYSLDHGSTWKAGNVLFLCGGTRTLLFRSTDVAGNVEKRQSITVSTPLCGGP